MGVGDAAVELRGIGKRYGTTRALDDVSLRVDPGELLFVLGPSGAGKSTLLRIIGGYERPDAGVLSIGGRRVGGLPIHRRDIGMVFQSYALFPHMSVEDNVGFGLRMRGVGGPARSERVRWALGLVRLEGLERRFPRQLSGGQQQRVALARAIAFRPALLLLDEPLASLDRRLRDEMRIELRQLQRQLGITTLFVTHDQEESLTMADRVVVMHDGAVQQIAPPAELYNAPGNPFVASFIGEMNALRGAVVGSDRGAYDVRLGGLIWRVVCERPLSVGERVTVCLRAERISGDPSPPSSPVALAPRSAPVPAPSRDEGASRAEHDVHNTVDGTVRFSSYLGATTLYLVEASDRTILKVAEPNAAGRARFAPGDAVRLSWPVDAAMVFPE
jgi:putative spermidine/putrescine transport system ATP-binding protein